MFVVFRGVLAVMEGIVWLGWVAVGFGSLDCVIWGIMTAGTLFFFSSFNLDTSLYNIRQHYDLDILNSSLQLQGESPDLKLHGASHSRATDCATDNQSATGNEVGGPLNGGFLKRLQHSFASVNTREIYG
ncbi:hypothetical protein ACRALDRAFT_2022700 [Sodiomyces alcalophilus JCM 7366]|uniref:uncharacterized protein n=1 Tax=Sodiomyces alcalophilus JCM 7366 TaxID=591952 RepID=UPI0039B462E6